MRACANLWKRNMAGFLFALFGCAEAKAELTGPTQNDSGKSSIAGKLFRVKNHGMVEFTAIGDIYITGELCEMSNCWNAPPTVTLVPLNSTSQVFVTAKFSGPPGPNSCTNAFITAFDERGGVKTIPIGRESPREKALQIESWCKLVSDWYLKTPWLRRMLIYRFLASIRGQ